MAEQISTKPNRPPLFKVTRGATLKGSQVELLGTPDDKPLDALKPNDRVWVREFLYYRAPDSQTPLREAHIEWRNLARAWRTKDEEALGREFTDDEAAEYDRVIYLKVAEHQAKYLREQILSKLESIAKGLERAAEEVRRAAAQSERYDLSSSVYRVQHDLAWLFPNLGADQLTTDLVGWLQMDAEIKRRGGASDQADS